MKKLFAILAFLVFMSLPVLALAAGSVVEQRHDPSAQWAIVFVTCTADSADASYPSTDLDDVEDAELTKVEVYFGGTSPTDGATDITLKNQYGVDIIAPADLLNMDTSTKPKVVPKIDTVYGYDYVYGPATVAITGNAVNSAVIYIILYYKIK